MPSDASPASIPIIRLWDILLVPIQGDLPDRIAEQLRADVLTRVQESGTRHVIVDVSGVWFMDSHLCMVLSQLAKAARYMGCSTIVTGLSPDVALTLQSMGLHIGTGTTMRNLEQALVSLGVAPKKRADKEDDDIIRRITLGDREKEE